MILNLTIHIVPFISPSVNQKPELNVWAKFTGGRGRY